MIMIGEDSLVNNKIIKTEEFSINFRDSKIKQPQFLEHYHDSYELDLFIKANIQIFVKDRKYEIADGDILFISEYEVHKIIYNMGEHYTRYVINFKKDFLLDLLNFLELKELFGTIEKNQLKKAALNLNRRNEIEGLCKTMHSIYNQSLDINSLNKNVRTMALIKSYLVIFLIRFDDMLKAANNVSLIPQKKDSQVAEIIKYIDTNYMNLISLSVLEKEFHLNKYYISHIFKDITGLSIIEYTQYRRIIEAQKMLTNTNKDIVDICLDCGFNNMQHFYRVFSKITRVSPYKYRNKKK